MKRHNLDPKVLDFTWKQNRLSKDKEALKNSMLDVIRKKPKQTNIATAEEELAEGQGGAIATNPQTSVMPRESGVANINAGYTAGVQGGNGGTNMAMQQAPAAF